MKALVSDAMNDVPLEKTKLKLFEVIVSIRRQAHRDAAGLPSESREEKEES
jgi:hypothetical protein